MHRAAHTFIEAILPTEYLRQRAIEHVDRRQFTHRLHVTGEALHHAQSRAVVVRLHDRHEIVVVHLRDGAEALGENFAVAAVRAKDEVVCSKVIRLAHSRRLLADGEVRWALMVVFDALIRILLLDAVEHGLEFANIGHVPVHLHQRTLAIFLCLGLRVRHIGVDGDCRTGQSGRLSHFAGVYRNRLRHGIPSLYIADLYTNRTCVLEYQNYRKLRRPHQI